MRICKLLIAALFIGFHFPADGFCIAPVNPNLNPTARQVLNYLESVYQTKMLWGWKIHAQDYSIDVALEHPERPASWTTIYSEKDHPYITWEATYRISFRPVPARYVRLHATKRAGRQTWGGYQLAALEVPVPSHTVVEK